MDSYADAYRALDSQVNKIISLTYNYIDIAAEAGCADVPQMKKEVNDVEIMINNIRNLFDASSNEIAASAFCWKQMLVALSYLVVIIRKCDLAIVSVVSFIDGECLLCGSQLIKVNDFVMCRFCGKEAV